MDCVFSLWIQTKKPLSLMKWDNSGFPYSGVVLQTGIIFIWWCFILQLVRNRVHIGHRLRFWQWFLQRSQQEEINQVKANARGNWQFVSWEAWAQSSDIFIGFCLNVVKRSNSTVFYLWFQHKSISLQKVVAKVVQAQKGNQPFASVML